MLKKNETLVQHASGTTKFRKAFLEGGEGFFFPKLFVSKTFRSKIDPPFELPWEALEILANHWKALEINEIHIKTVKHH